MQRRLSTNDFRRISCQPDFRAKEPGFEALAGVAHLHALLMTILDAVQAKLLSPAVLFYVLGVFAALVRSDLKFAVHFHSRAINLDVSGGEGKGVGF